jgi:hypothetical protein
MLPIPTTTTGLGYEEVDETSVYADWIECSTLFYGEEISKSDVKECFSEINSFNSETGLSEIDNIWCELGRRKRLLGARYPIKIDGNRIKLSIKSWKDFVAYSFCSLLSYSKSNKEWMHKYCNDYQKQGELFECISKAALMYFLNDWDTILTGWSKSNPTNIKNKIKDIADALGTTIGQISPDSDDKDGGVDILCYRKFSDARGNYPVFLIQCATGANWADKRMLDALHLWRHWIYFYSPDLISRGFAVPFAFGDETFLQTQIRGNCLVLDRIRLLAQEIPESEWLPSSLLKELSSWVEQKIKTFED